MPVYDFIERPFLYYFLFCYFSCFALVCLYLRGNLSYFFISYINCYYLSLLFWDNSILFFSQSIWGLCIFSQSWPKNTLTFPRLEMPKSISSSWVPMATFSRTHSVRDPALFLVPSTLYTGIGCARGRVLIPCSLTHFCLSRILYTRSQVMLWFHMSVRYWGWLLWGEYPFVVALMF